MQGFLGFLREKGVVGLAIGFLMGGAVSKLVTSFVEDFVNPLIGLLLSKVGDLAAASFSIGPAVVKWGEFVSSFIDFTVIAVIIYLGFRILEFRHHDKKEEPAK